MRVHWQAVPLDEDGKVLGPANHRWSDHDGDARLTAPPGLFEGEAHHWRLSVNPASYRPTPLIEHRKVDQDQAFGPKLTDSEKARLEGPGVPWDALDKGIVPIVEALTLARFTTIASCQGHGEGDAWVVILDDLQAGTVDQVESLIERCGWARHCVISQEQEIGGDSSWIRLRWWGGVPYR